MTRKKIGSCSPWEQSELNDIQTAISAWFTQQATSMPWQENKDPYAILVSEMMLQQTRVETLLAGTWYQTWLKRFPNAAALASADQAEVLSCWQGLGYYNRARNLQKAAQLVVENNNGTWPNTAAELQNLPGIGSYTAAAVASIAFDEPVAAVDANVIRILARIGNYSTPIHRKEAVLWFQEKASLWVPFDNPGKHNSALMQLGQKICTPRLPKCPTCPLQDWCQCLVAEQLPVKKAPVKVTEITEHALWAVRDFGSEKQILLSQEQGSRRKGFWQLPLRTADEVDSLKKLSSQTYSITRYRVRHHIYQAKLPEKQQPQDHESWWNLDQLTQVALTAPTKKAIQTLSPNTK